MIYCEYNEHFKKLKQKNRILSIPILKNTCINCRFKDECNITRTTNVRRNNEILIRSLLDMKRYINESIADYYRIQKDIRDGLYDETYTYDLMVLDDVENKSEAIVFQTDEFGAVDQFTVEEYLNLYPNMVSKKKLVGIHKVTQPSDVCYGLNIQELEEDLEYIDEELRRLNKNNNIN